MSGGWGWGEEENSLAQTPVAWWGGERFSSDTSGLVGGENSLAQTPVAWWGGEQFSSDTSGLKTVQSENKMEADVLNARIIYIMLTYALYKNNNSIVFWLLFGGGCSNADTVHIKQL